MQHKLRDINAKELELPETVFVRDIENRVFQSIALQCLSRIEGIGLIEGSFIDNLLGRDVERVKGISVEQDQKSHSVKLKIELNIAYGVCIPEKAEEIQVKVVEEMSQYTGLHVGSIHLVFKNLVTRDALSQHTDQSEALALSSIDSM